MMIFILIAGSYTPICLITLKGRTGLILLSIVWGIAIVGILIKASGSIARNGYLPFSTSGWDGPAYWLSHRFSTHYRRRHLAGFLAGGIIYTIGGIIYALKLPIFNSKHKNFGSHEIFHLFVMAGSACHFIVMYCYLI